MLSVQSVENRVTVECLVHHPALYSQPLIDFVKIGKNGEYNSLSLSHSLSLEGAFVVITSEYFYQQRK